MLFEKTAVSNQLEILKVKTGGEYFKPVKLADSAFTDGVCKAGNIIKADGSIDTTGDATVAGVLLNDTYSDNPNTTVVSAFGVINEANANKNAGITISTAQKEALSNLVFA